MLRELVNLIAEDMGEDAPPPATEREIAELQERSLRELNLRVPDQYVEFLRLMDGCYVSSEQFCATHEREFPSFSIGDLIEFNKLCRVDFLIPEDIFCIGSGGTKYIRGWSESTKSWSLVSGGNNVYRAKDYATFAEVLADSIQDACIDTRPLLPTSFEYFSRDDDGKKVYGTGSP
jgi:hypothetical protein